MRCEDYGSPCPQQALQGYWGIDKQTGSERFGTLPRHEAVLVGIGRNEEKWVLARRIIDQVVFEHVDDDGVVTEDWERIVPFGPDAARQIWDMVDEPWVRPDGSVLPIRRVGVDVSDEQERGMAMCAHPESRRRRLLPMKGPSETWGYVSKRAQAITGSTVANAGVQLNLVGTQRIKDYLDLCIGMEPGQPFSIHFPKAVAGTDFFRQLTAEKLVFDEKRPGLSKWMKEHDHEPNEVLDCVVMAVAAMRYQWKKSATTRKAPSLDEGIARPRRMVARVSSKEDAKAPTVEAPVTLNASRPTPDASETGGRALPGVRRISEGPPVGLEAEAGTGSWSRRNPSARNRDLAEVS